MADTPSSEGGSWGFESPLPYRLRCRARVTQTAEVALSKRVSVRVRLPPRASRARVAQTGRGGILKTCTVRVRVSPRAFPRGRSIKVMQQVPTLRSRQGDTCLFDSGRPCQTFPLGGVCKWLKRAVLQTVALGGFAGSSP